MKITLFALILSLTSCSLFSNRKIDYSEGYVTGKGIEALSTEEIRNQLYRDISMSGGNYKIVAFPLTSAYVNALSNEMAGVKNLSKKGAKKLKENLLKKFVKNKVCIDTKITVKESDKVKSLEDWRLVFVDSDNIAYQLSWMPVPPYESKIPETVPSTIQGWHGKQTMWNMAGTACTTANSEMKKGFKVIFKPSFVQWPFPDEVEEEWSFNYTKIVDGKEVKVKKKEKKKMRYRGW